MNKQLIKNISNTLQKIAKSVISPQSDFNKDVIWGCDNIILYLTKEADLNFIEQVDKILKYSDFSSKFSSKFIDSKLKKIFASCLRNPNFNLEEQLTELIRELEEFNECSEVYLKVEGILLKEMCFELGKVKFTPGDESLLQFLRERAERRVGIEIFNSFWEDNFNELQGDCVAIVKVKAIPEKSYEIAKQEVRIAIDLIRYCSKILYPLHEDIRGHLEKSKDLIKNRVAEDKKALS